MQGAQGKDAIKVSLAPPEPSEGEEVCMLVETGMDSQNLSVVIIVNGRIEFSGTLPPTKEVCVTTQEGDGGGEIIVAVNQNNANGPAAAFGGTGALISSN